jgi:5'-nucleotidase
MKILVSNDDGVYAQGIMTLVESLNELGEIYVVAPDRNRSGASNSLSLSHPIRTKTLPNGFISVEGTPTDCVHIALTGMLESTPDMVVSGINEGGNLGDDILYSGTVAAAMEGRYLGLPAMAISLCGERPIEYGTAASVAIKLIKRLRSDPLPAQIILNINVPNLPLDQIRGFQVTRLGTRHGAEPVVFDHDPRGKPIYWIGPPGLEQDAGPGTDFYAISHNYVSITPLHIDLTHYASFEQLSHWTQGLSG